MFRKLWIVSRRALRRFSTTAQSTSCELDEELYSTLSEKLGVQSVSPGVHRVMVVHPKIRWGSHSASALTTSDLQLQEAVALVKTLPYFTVSNTMIVGTDYTTKRKRIWGQGRIDALVEAKQKERATAMMINVDVLYPMQQASLEGN